MEKKRYIKEKDRTLSPYPLYPAEVRDNKESAGKFKNNESSSSDFNLADENATNFSYELVAKNLKGLSL